MAQQNSRTFKLVIALAVAAGLPAMIIGEKLVLGDGLPVQAIAVMIAAYAVGLFWAGVGVARSTETVAGLAPGVDAAVREHMPALELLDTVPYVAQPASVRVTGGSGACPWGLQVGDRLGIEAGGRLSSPLCRTAVAALGPALGRLEDGGDRGTAVSCRCPMADRHRTFLAQTIGAVSTN